MLARVGKYVLYESAWKERAKKHSWKGEKDAKSEYVEEWIRKHLTVAKALRTLDVKALALEDKINDYRYSVLFHALMEDYLDKKLGREVSEEAIRSYYEQEKENFLLTKNILRYLYIKLPKSEAGMQRYARYVRKNTPESRKELAGYCLRSQAVCVLNHDKWDEYVNLHERLPQKAAMSFARLKKRSMWTFRDDAHVYYLHVLAHQSMGDLAPLDYVSELIVALIINQRKAFLQEAFDKDLWEEATQKREFTRYEL